MHASSLELLDTVDHWGMELSSPFTVYCTIAPIHHQRAPMYFRRARCHSRLKGQILSHHMSFAVSVKPLGMQSVSFFAFQCMYTIVVPQRLWANF